MGEGIIRLHSSALYINLNGSPCLTHVVTEGAARCGDLQPDPATLVAGLQDWQRRRIEALEERKTAQREWAELETLLNGRTLDQMEVESKRKAEVAERLIAGLDPRELKEVRLVGDVEGKLSDLRTKLRNADAQVARLREQTEQMKAGLRSVAEAEEELAAAEKDLGRVRDLDQTLQRTVSFLEHAQDRIHRTVAPLLRDSLNKSLPSVTSGRYEEALVDPKTLEVKVRATGGQWRNARLLSHGTAEQVYLLLRIAMVEHLTKERAESCPIVLDDVMVQCDSKRKKALLDLLHGICDERQVILFTLEEEVAEWARHNLQEPRDRLECLDATAIQA
jgi:uncharacterized protein YhaN